MAVPGKAVASRNSKGHSLNLVAQSRISHTYLNNHQSPWLQDQSSILAPAVISKTPRGFQTLAPRIEEGANPIERIILNNLETSDARHSLQAIAQRGSSTTRSALSPDMKYSHQWVTLAEKYEMQKPTKSIKPGSHKDYLDSTGGNTLLLMRASKLKTSQADTMNYEARALRDCTFSP